MGSSATYLFGQQLGSGVDGVVRIYTDRSSGLRFACKSVPKSDPDSLRHILREISFLQKLRGHPNIIASHGHFEDDQCIHLILDLCEGGDLCEYIVHNGPLSEIHASQAMAAILRAISFCHSKGIIHRDLKAENILFPSKKSMSFCDLKLADFGAAADFSKEREFGELEGTPWYMAPEVLTGRYDEKVDVWSLGVLLYIMLSGCPPFTGEGTKAIFEAIKRGRLDLRTGPWMEISEDAKGLLKGMLQKNPYRRMRLRDVVMHPWIQRSGASGSGPAAAAAAMSSSSISTTTTFACTGSHLHSATQQLELAS